MGKKFRSFCKSARGPLAWILTLILVWQLFPAQGMAYALEEAAEALASTGVDAVVVEDTLVEPEEAPVEEDSEVEPEVVVEEEPVVEPEPTVEPDPAIEPEPTVEPDSAVEPAVEPEPVVEPEATESEPAPATPMLAGAKSLVVDGVTITVGVDDGVLPEGWYFTAEPVTGEMLSQVEDAVAEQQADAQVVVAFDITLYDADGNEIQPADGTAVRVTFRNTGAETNDVSVYHVSDEMVAEYVDTTAASANRQSFDADKFSVYVVVETVVPRLTVTFKNGDATIETMYVKAADTAEEVNTIIFDPGAGTITAGQVFKGWTTEQNYTADTTFMTIEQVRADAMAKAAALDGADGSVTYYAAMFKQYTITYVDGDDVTVGTEVVEIPARETNATYTINQGFSTDDSHNFEGWHVADGLGNIVSPADVTAETLLPNDIEITIKGDVKFSVSAPLGHWLIFDENGKGATYNAPQFIKAGKTTSDEGLLDMVRNGYTFKGWYTGAPTSEGGDPTGELFQFGGTIDQTTTIYAKWEANSTADYTVLIWKQNVAGDGYDFVDSVSENGTVGSVPTAVNTSTGRVSGSDYAGETGFSYKNTDQASKTIAPEGNTVVNVYYDRNEYTLTFQIYDYTYTPTTSNEGTQYGLVDGEYIQLTRHNEGSYWNPRYYWTYNDGWFDEGPRYTGTRYTRSRRQSWQTVETITALYGQNIREKFPIVGSNGVTYTGASWSSVGSSIFNDEAYVSYIDVMQAESTTFHLAYNPTHDYYTYHVKYYVEALPGDTDTVTYSDKEFVLYHDAEIRMESSDLISTESEEFTNITGYTKFAANPPYDSEGHASFDDNWTISLYYTRNTYAINYMDGAYYDGNDNRIASETSQGQLDVVGGIAYGADLTSYNKSGANYFEPTAPAGYVFEGWYIDDACTHPYDFTTMPEGGLTVYAKWRQIQFRVFLHPNAGTDPSLRWGSSSQDMNFRVNYGGQVSTPTGIRTGYEFYGWYTDEACTQVFSSARRIFGGEPYDKETHMTDPMDRWGNGATTNSDVDRFWITQEFNLYAKWSEVVIGAKGIGVVYDANGGTNAPNDSALYKDNTSVSAGAAPTAPAGKLFDHWVLQTWDGEKYVDTETTVSAGGTFTIHMSDAKVTDAATHEVVDEVIDDGQHHYNYAVQLKAVYKDKGVETPTHIDWYSNYGSENDGKGTLYHSDTNIKINEAVDILGSQTRAGYTFKGWTKSKGGASADFLVWDGSKYTTTDGTTATQVAADERQPYEDLFAVWEENEVTINYVVADGQERMGSVSSASETVKVDTGTASGSTATATSNTYIFDYWTVDEGTEPISTDAAFVPQKNADGLYEAHTYVAHFKLNKADVTVHHYLKGTTTKVADDVKSQEIIGTEYTATPVTTYQEKNLTVDSYNPSQTVTVSADGNVITIYYTLPLTIEAKSGNKTYDGTPLAGDYTITGALPGDDTVITGALGEAPSITDAGTRNYPTAEDQAEITGIPPYYVVTYTPGTLTINKAKITLTGSSTVTYNGAEQKLELNAADATGVVAGETLGFQRTPTVKGTNVGTYTDVDYGIWYVTKANGDDSTANYTIAVTGKLTINKAPITVTLNGNSTTKDYNGETQTFEGTVTPTSESTLFDASKVAYTGTTAVTGKLADTYTEDIDITEASYDDANLDVTFVAGTPVTLEITPLKVIVTIKGNTEEKVYNGAEQSVTDYTATANSDLYDVTSDFTYGGSKVAKGTDVGMYAMGLDKDQFVNINSNFEVTFDVTDGALYITPKAVTVTAIAKSYTYNGNPQGPAGTYSAAEYAEFVTVEGLVGGDTLSSITLAGEKKYAGTYEREIVPSALEVRFNHETTKPADWNYHITYVPATLTISKSTMTVSVTGYTGTYDGKPHTVTATPSVDEGTTLYYSTDNQTWETTAPTWTDVTNGEKTVYVKAVNPNYEDATGSATVTIDKAKITLTGSDTVTYNGAEQKLELNADDATGVVAGEALGFQRTPTVKGTNAGTYTEVDYGVWHVTKADGTTDSTDNYDIEVTGTLTIKPAAITIKADDKSKVYDNDATTDPELIATVTGKPADGAAPVYSLSREPGQDVDEYEITVTAEADANPNYTVTVESGTFAITRRPVTVTIEGDRIESVYNGLPHNSTYHLTTTDTLYNVSTMVTSTAPESITRTIVGQTDMNLAIDQFTNTDPNFDVTFRLKHDGFVRISPKHITVTANDVTKTYDGQPAKTNGATVTGLVNGESEDLITYTVAFGVEDITNVQVTEGAVVASGESVQGNYVVSYAPGKLTITKAEMTVTVANYTGTYDGAGHTVTATPSVTEGTKLYYSTDGEEWSETAPTFTDVSETPATVYVKATNSNYEDVTSSGTVTITKAKITLTGTSTVTYNGTEQKLELKATDATGVVSGETLGFERTPTVKGIDAGKYDYVDYGTWYVTKADGKTDSTGNYEIEVTGTLTITKAQLTITAEDQNYTYNGQEQGPAGTYTEGFDAYVTVTGLQGGDTLSSITLAGKQTNAGTYENEIIPSAAEVMFNHDTDKTILDNYVVSYTKADLTIKKLELAISITGNNDTKNYDGAEHTVEGYKASCDDSLFDASKVSYSGQATASQTNVGTAQMNLDASKFSYSDVNVTATFTIAADGYMKVNPAKVTITAESANKAYDGTALTQPEFKVEGLAEGDTHEFAVVMTADSTITNKGTQPNVIATVDDVTVAAGEETAVGNYLVTTVDGTLKITPKAVTITAKDANKVYDGTALTQPEFTVEGLAEGDTHEFAVVMTADSTITNVGTKPNVIATVDGTAVTKGEAKEIGNYVVTTTDGTLTITKDTSALVITSATKSWTYDGQNHKEEVYTVTYNGQTVSADDTGKVFTLSNGDVVTITATAAGVTNVSDNASNNNTYTYTIKRGDADASGNYESVVANIGTLTINKAPVTITVTGKKETVTYNGAEQSLDGFTVSIDDPSGTATHGIYVTGEKPVVKGTDADTYPMGLTEDIIWASETAGNYDITFVVNDGSLTIEKADLTITAKDQTYTYNGKAQGPAGTYTEGFDTYVTVTGLQGGDTLSSITLAGSQTNAGTYTDEIIPSAAAVTFNHETEKGITDNYNVTYENADLTIEAKKVTITAKDADKVYDGTALTQPEFKVEGLAEGDTHTFTVEMTAESTITNAGSQPNVIATVDGTAVTTGVETKVGNYLVTTADGTLEITKAPLTITAEPQNYTYNGQAQGPAGTYTEGFDTYVTVEGLKGSDQLTSITLAGSQTNAGTYTGEIVPSAAAIGNATGNYEIAYVNGTLTIGKRHLDIIGADAEKVYDGEMLDGDVKPGEGQLADGDWLQSFSENTFGPEVGTGEHRVSGATILHGTEVPTPNVTDNYDITYVPGTYTIKPCPVTITAESANKAYDGTALTQPEFTVEGLAETDKHEFTVVMTADSTITNVGTQPNVIATVDGTAVETGKQTAVGNYLVTTADGKLTITEDANALVITSATSSHEYDGQLYKDETYTVTYKDEAVTADSTGKVFTLPNGDIVTITATAAGVTNVADNAANNNTYTYAITRDGADVSGNYKSVVANTGTISITARPVTVTITGEQVVETYDGKAHTAAWTMTSSDEMYDVDTMVTTTAAANVSRTDVGTSELGLTKDQFTNTNGNFDVTFVVDKDATVTITARKVTVTITGEQIEKTYDGTEYTAAWSMTSSDEMYDVDTMVTTTAEVSVSRTDVGESKLGLTKDQFTNTNGNFDVTFDVEKDATVKITARAVTVTITGNKDSKPYNGEEQKVEGYKVEISDPLYKESDFTFSGTKVAKGTDVDTYPMGLAKSQFTNNNENFDVTFEVTDGSLEITPIDVTVTIVGHNNTATYDSKEHTVTGYDVEISDPLYTEDDFSFNGTAEAKRTGVGTTYMGLAKEQFKNTNKNFGTVTFEVTDGFQTINPVGEVTVTITEHSGTATYDGKEHTVTGYDVEISDPLYTEDDFTFSGTASVSGTNAGTYDMELKPENFKNTNENFDKVTFVIVDGTLVIDKAKVTVTITGAEDSKTYNGSEQKIEGYTVGIVDELYSEDYIKFSGEAVAKGTDVGTYDMGLTKDQFANTNDNFDVTFNVTDGSLEITKLAVTVTITGNTDSKVYNGSEQQVEGYKVEISDPLYKESDFAFSGEAVAKGTDVGTYDMGLKKEQFANNNTNFDVTFTVTDGKLEITPVTDQIVVTITGHKDTKVYNGSEQQVSGYDVKTSNPLYTEDDFSFSGTNVAKGTNAGTYPMGLAESQFANTSKNFSNVKFDVTDGELKITTKDVTIVVDDATKVYGSDDPTFTGTVTGLVNDGDLGTISYIRTNNDENVGTYSNVLDARFETNPNYTVAVTKGNFEITQKSISDATITVDPLADVVYNGAEQKQEPVVKDSQTGETLVKDKDYTLSYSGDTKNVTDEGVTVTITGIGNYTGETTISYKITPAPLTITTADDKKVYDGTELTNHTYTIELDGNTIESDAEMATLLGDDTIRIEITGTQTLVGSSDNTGLIHWAEGEQNEFVKAIPNLAAANEPTAKQSNYAVIATSGTLTVTDDGVDIDKVVSKTHEDKEYGLGDTVTFTLTATNIYDDPRTITFEELEGVEIEQAVFENVEPGATVTTTATYTVTEADILAGEFKNTVTVKIGDADPYTKDDIVDIEDKNPHITVTKTVTSTATSYAAGDTIEYKIVAENDGNLTLTDVKVTDALTGDEWTVEELKPGDKKEFTAKYTVTEADANAGKVVNTATATGTDPEGNKPGVTPGTAETPITKPALPKTGDASGMVEAATFAFSGFASLAGWLGMKRRRNEDDER